MSISPVIEDNLVSEKEIVLVVSPVIYLFYDVSNSFAGPSKTVLWILQHNLPKYIAFNQSNFGH